MPTLPDFGAAVFIPGAPIDNPYFPLVENTILTYSGSKVDEDSGEVETETTDTFATTATKDIAAGVEAFVVHDVGYLNGVLIEDTLDYYAQDTAGNVWYLGELSYAFQYDDDGQYIGTTTAGSWEAGVDGALPGIIMEAAPAVGDSYYQEFLAGEAEDEALVLDTDAEVEIGLGDFTGVLRTQDTTALEPDVLEIKSYAPGVGQILTEEDINDEGEPELSIELVGIREVGAGAAGADIDQPEAGDFAGEGEEVYVTYLGKEAGYENALGAYIFDIATGEIGEGRILFESTEDLEFGDQIAVEVGEGEGLGLFLIPNVEDFSLDLSGFEDGGLFFRNFLTGDTATLSDVLSPLVTDAAGTVLPIQAFHALGGEDGFNFLNPAAGAQASEIDLDCLVGDEDDDVALIGFEDLRVTQDGFDGDYNDFVVAVSEDPDEDILDVDDLIVGTADCDWLRGGRGDEVLLGRAGDDRLSGYRGDDSLCGDDGRDRLSGGRGDDALFGGDGRDTLDGGRGDDFLAGGDGDDVLKGGRGEDIFAFGLGEGDDLVKDFKVGVDRIDLSETGLAFEDLSITSAGCRQAHIDLGDGSITLSGVNVSQLDEASFIF